MSPVNFPLGFSVLSKVYRVFLIFMVKYIVPCYAGGQWSLEPETHSSGADALS